MRIPDAQLGQWYRLVMDEGDVAAGDPLEAKLALARFIVTRSHGEAAAQDGRSALHARRARGPRARRGARGCAAGRRPRASAVAAGRRPRDRHHERGSPPHRAERRQADGEVVTGARSAAGAARRGAPSGRKAPLRAVSSGVAIPLLPCPRRLARGCMKPANDTGDPSSQKIRPTYHLARGAFGVNRRLFSGPQQRVWSLKTQQRETSRLFGWSVRGRAEELLKPVVSCRCFLSVGHDFELKLTCNQLLTSVGLPAETETDSSRRV